MGEIVEDFYVQDKKIKSENGFFKKSLQYKISILERATIKFSFFEINKPYKPIAGDAIRIQG